MSHTTFVQFVKKSGADSGGGVAKIMCGTNNYSRGPLRPGSMHGPPKPNSMEGGGGGGGGTPNNFVADAALSAARLYIICCFHLIISDILTPSWRKLDNPLRSHMSFSSHKFSRIFIYLQFCINAVSQTG